MNATPGSLRWALSIGQSMAVILIISLCAVPLTMAMKMGRGEYVLIAALVDAVVFPAVATLTLLFTMPSSARRDWCLMALWATPILSVGALLACSVPAILLGVY
ncbi:hypothetical protein ACYOEI_37405 [Singulisphaera rosea]